MKILTVIGARPQFIKAIAFSRVVAKTPSVEEILLHTGQHYDDNMSAVFFRELGLPEPQFRFDLGGGSHGHMTARQLAAIEDVLLEYKPDICLVYGDTNSTLAGAVAAAKLHIPVAHIEAGLRSFNRRMPEEINRVLTDHVSEWLFAPTQTAVDNLVREGVSRDKIHLVGDVMYDVAKLIIDHPDKRTDILTQLNLDGAPYAVVTLHRQETTDNPERLASILTALDRLAQEMRVVLPLHPRTRKTLAATSALAALTQRLIINDPLGFFDMATLLSGAKIVITDSGGLQKEAYFHGVPCVTVRDETEWVELVNLGCNTLPEDLSSDAIIDAITAALTMSGETNAQPFGDGHAAKKIIQILLEK